jgi:TATA-box binding protein (TBP) (component of TFIID and TFIIIB)
LDKRKQYPRITNEVVTFNLGVVTDLKRLSMAFPNMGKGSKFPANISKNDDGTSLIFTTGAVVIPGCETYYGAKYLAHLARLMVESVEQPVLVIDEKTRKRKLVVRTLQGLTKFSDFRVVNIVSNGRLTKDYISLAEMEADDYRLDWNPNYFPGLEHILTREDVPFKESVQASMTIFDSGKGVGMGVKCREDSYLAYQYVAAKALRYPDRKYVQNGSKFEYRQQQKRLHSIENRQLKAGAEKSVPTKRPPQQRKRKIGTGGASKKPQRSSKAVAAANEKRSPSKGILVTKAKKSEESSVLIIGSGDNDRKETTKGNSLGKRKRVRFEENLGGEVFASVAGEGPKRARKTKTGELDILLYSDGRTRENDGAGFLSVKNVSAADGRSSLPANLNAISLDDEFDRYLDGFDVVL